MTPITFSITTLPQGLVTYYIDVSSSADGTKDLLSPIYIANVYNYPQITTNIDVTNVIYSYLSTYIAELTTANTMYPTLVATPINGRYTKLWYQIYYYTQNNPTTGTKTIITDWTSANYDEYVSNYRPLGIPTVIDNLCINMPLGKQYIKYNYIGLSYSNNDGSLTNESVTIGSTYSITIPTSTQICQLLWRPYSYLTTITIPTFFGPKTLTEADCKYTYQITYINKLGGIDFLVATGKTELSNDSTNYTKFNYQNYRLGRDITTISNIQNYTYNLTTEPIDYNYKHLIDNLLHSQSIWIKDLNINGTSSNYPLGVPVSIQSSGEIKQAHNGLINYELQFTSDIQYKQIY